MPWRECSAMEERLRFVARLLDGEAMSDVCRGFGISRKTGYKIFEPLQGARAGGAHRPLAAAGALRQPAAAAGREPDRRPEAGQAALGRAQAARAAGPAAQRRCAGAGQEHHPCRSRPPRPGQACARAAPPRHGHAACRRAPRPTTSGAPTSRASSSSATGATATRSPSPTMPRRYLLMCEALDSAREEPAFTAFEQLFAERGLPDAIRSDNGVPFASPNGLYNLSKLSVWWLQARHRDRAHQARPPAAERPPRAHAPHLEEGGDPAARHEQPAAAGPLRRLPRRVQHRAAAPGARR